MRLRWEWGWDKNEVEKDGSSIWWEGSLSLFKRKRVVGSGWEGRQPAFSIEKPELGFFFFENFRLKKTTTFEIMLKAHVSKIHIFRTHIVWIWIKCFVGNFQRSRMIVESEAVFLWHFLKFWLNLNQAEQFLVRNQLKIRGWLEQCSLASSDD